MDDPQPKKKHNLLAGAAVAAAGIPLYKGAFKLGRVHFAPQISHWTGKPQHYGRQVADYIEASQHVLNQGISGKISGLMLRHPQSHAVKQIVGPGGMTDLGRQHYSSFRANATEALDAWGAEVSDHYGKRAAAAKKARQPNVAKALLSKQEEHNAKHIEIQEHLSNLWKQGYNEKEALRHAAEQPEHQDYFRRLITFKKEPGADQAGKIGPIRSYAEMSAGLSAAPLAAGAAVAATKRKTRQPVQTTKQLSARLDDLIQFGVLKIRATPAYKNLTSGWPREAQQLIADSNRAKGLKQEAAMRKHFGPKVKLAKRAYWDDKGKRVVSELSAKLDELIEFARKHEEPEPPSPYHDLKRGPSWPKIGALYGVGLVSGAGIATGNKLASSFMQGPIKRFRRAYRAFRK